MNRPVVIVNPISSGSELAPAFAKRGVPSVAVRPAPTGKSAYAGFAGQINAENYLHVFDMNQPDLTERLRELNPLAILPGSESAVLLSDELTAQLAPAFLNESRLSKARRHKGLMQEALARAGLPVIPTLDTASADQVAAWIQRQGLADKPLVVKPPASAGSDKVYHIDAGGDWRSRFEEILATPAVLGKQVNQTVIVQEQVTGVEYGVDTVSANGRHVLAHLVRYKKSSAADRKTVFDYTEFVPFDPRDHAELWEYTQRALDALGIRWGAAHNEIMMTADGPRLIETGARLCGGPVIEFARAATGASQVERVVEAYLDGEFKTTGYTVKQTVVPVFISSPATGVLRNIEVLEGMRSLPTHLATHLWRKNGDRVPRTLDFNTVLGIIALAGPRAAVFADYARIREAEARLVVEDEIS